jgi:2-keto-3-deoxy-L-fuconate dehydrogenase
MADRLKGKLAFCTASGAGIGRATAIAFAREGARVIASDIDEAAFADLKAAGVAECVKIDARDTATVEAQAKRLGAVDVLFNAAGFVHHGTVLDCSEEDWDLSFDLNVKSMHRTIKAFLPAMLAKGGGSIVNVASTVSSVRAAPNRYVYGATKAAIIGLTKAVAMDFIAKGIRSTTASPPSAGRSVGPTRRARCSSPASPWAASARRRKWPPSPCIWPPTNPPSRRARLSSPTVGLRCEPAACVIPALVAGITIQSRASALRRSLDRRALGSVRPAR